MPERATTECSCYLSVYPYWTCSTMFNLWVSEFNLWIVLFLNSLEGYNLVSRHSPHPVVHSQPACYTDAGQHPTKGKQSVNSFWFMIGLNHNQRFTKSVIVILEHKQISPSHLSWQETYNLGKTLRTTCWTVSTLPEVSLFVIIIICNKPLRLKLKIMRFTLKLRVKYNYPWYTSGS